MTAFTLLKAKVLESFPKKFEVHLLLSVKSVKKSVLTEQKIEQEVQC